MSVQTHLDFLTVEITQRLLGSPNNEITWDQLKQIGKLTSDCACKVKLANNGIVPYGRYLVFKNDLFNLQLDVFSKSYLGAPHNHESWGIICGISGELGITDYLLENEKLTAIRTGILRMGSALCFMRETDWHSTETFSGDQVASFHVYGPEFNLEYGFRYSNSAGFERYRRGVLHKLSDHSQIIELRN
jgi:hypothetical protein